MKKVMKASKKYIITLACFAVVLVACIGATIGITMAYFGDVKSDTADIVLGAAIEFDGTAGIDVAATNVSGSIVPSQVVDVKTTLKIVKGAQGETTKGVLQLTPEFDAGGTGVTCSFADNATFAVTGDVTGVLKAKDNKLYLVESANSDNLVEITPTTEGVSLSFIVQVTVPESLDNKQGGKTISMTMTAKVLQSTIYAGGSTVAKTISGFASYFNGFTGPTA